ncbi:hypothetical protein WSK_0349 [Novosphingobium sp. Rr 2-17]|uniref:alpha/beta fold hydrolase n=1 Tax=Novosphingobium sp. Rr 2-17 TaxID=555793 RepID=UPI0002698E81|nr:alpha/beta hydrolase [Novosphingobium sp. Rr 2-17]EIZ80957.1 hypothetical protein WSK_0349 [Novosphingobium sp. Rr 2-17]
MKLLFAHGWGFDRHVWAPLSALLADVPQAIDDRGYFGAPHVPAIEGPSLAVTHSYGAMRVLADPPPGLTGVVAINGFDRFTAIPGRPGVPMRVVDYMLTRFELDPRGVLTSFRASVGCEEAFGEIDAEALHLDLKRLRDGQPAPASVPVLVIHGDQDPLLPEPMRRASFAGSTVRRINHKTGGHVLPLEAPELCALAIRGMLA